MVFVCGGSTETGCAFSASRNTRPSISEDAGCGTPRMWRIVGATSALPLGNSSMNPLLKSGPAATSVLCISNGLSET
jgi:hypothetical protein